MRAKALLIIFLIHPIIKGTMHGQEQKQFSTFLKWIQAFFCFKYRQMSSTEEPREKKSYHHLSFLEKKWILTRFKWELIFFQKMKGETVFFLRSSSLNVIRLYLKQKKAWIHRRKVLNSSCSCSCIVPFDFLMVIFCLW